MSMSDVGRTDGLGVIFSFFLGLLVTVFFGVGVFTFYPYPVVDQDVMDQLYDREQAIKGGRPWVELSAEEREQVDEIIAERQELYDEWERIRQRWARNTSIVLITLATATMAISLVRSHALPVVSNGLLLGGLFTMLYGVGWIFFTDSSILRFIVITLALAITLLLGYVRFVRKRQVPPSAVPVGAVPQTSADLASIEQRLRDLEDRINSAASVLGKGKD